MKKLTALVLVSLSLLSCGASAQIVLDNFNGYSSVTSGITNHELAGTSWIGNVTYNANSISVGGSAKDDNGWGLTGLHLNATGLVNLEITAQLESGNVAPFFVIQFSDTFLTTNTFSVSTSAFTVGSLTTVVVPIAFTGGFIVTDITRWNIGGGAPSPGSNVFRFTFDNLALAVPEPSTYALLALGLGVVLVPVLRRRRS